MFSSSDPLSVPIISTIKLGLSPGAGPKFPTIIDLRVIDLVSSPVWWEAETNIEQWNEISTVNNS